MTLGRPRRGHARTAACSSAAAAASSTSGPANAFVAGFIGSPAMSLLRASRSRANGSCDLGGEPTVHSARRGRGRRTAARASADCSSLSPRGASTSRPTGIAAEVDGRRGDRRRRLRLLRRARSAEWRRRSSLRARTARSGPRARGRGCKLLAAERRRGASSSTRRRGERIRRAVSRAGAWFRRRDLAEQPARPRPAARAMPPTYRRGRGRTITSRRSRSDPARGPRLLRQRRRRTASYAFGLLAGVPALRDSISLDDLLRRRSSTSRARAGHRPVAVGPAHGTSSSTSNGCEPDGALHHRSHERAATPQLAAGGGERPSPSSPGPERVGRGVKDLREPARLRSRCLPRAAAAGKRTEDRRRPAARHRADGRDARPARPSRPSEIGAGTSPTSERTVRRSAAVSSSPPHWRSRSSSTERVASQRSRSPPPTSRTGRSQPSKRSSRSGRSLRTTRHSRRSSRRPSALGLRVQPSSRAGARRPRSHMRPSRFPCRALPGPRSRHCSPSSPASSSRRRWLGPKGSTRTIPSS